MATTQAPPGAAPITFQPYIPPEKAPREFTLQAVLTGTVLGLVFAASSLYLVLKLGMTVSASIPVAVLALTLFRGLSKMFGFRRATILENNITQTAGSAGESIAFGVGVTMPALLLLGFDMTLPRVMLVSVLGGLLGILAMIPLRRAFIVKMHGRPGQPGTLLYPEGTACAQVLISGEKGGSTGATVFAGFGLAFLHKFITEGMSLLTQTLKVPLPFINKAAVFAHDMASELLGVGYIIGARTSSLMMAGAVLGYLVIIPIIYFIGVHAPDIIPPGEKPISEMDTGELRNKYLLFIGAGTVATAGIISMLRTLPMIVRGISSSLAGLRGGTAEGNGGPVRRTDDDMSMRTVLLGSLGLIVALAAYLLLEVPPVVAVLGAGLVVLFGFLFVTVSARLTGEIGSSSNPISGMTTATLMLTCLIFLSLGMTSSTERVLALMIAAVVCIASSNGGSTAQALKTGFLVGGTPKYMQYAILVGALVSALVIGYTLLALNNSRTVFSAKPENLPKVTLTKAELDRLTQTEVYQGKTYKVFDPRNGEVTDPDPKTGFEPRPELKAVKKAHYLVDPETGHVAYLRDDAIMGQLKEKDDGTPVKREFEAPKTQVLGIVINGVLKGDLNWSMVAIGAMIAIMLELCGVSALAFAVGVYVPIQFSAPIFVGGMVRLAVDSYLARQTQAEAAVSNDPEAKARAEIEAIRRSETSGGVLLASGYIAGGSLAGVLIAFLSFSDEIPKKLAQWQYREVAVGGALPLEMAADVVAQRELGLNRVTNTAEGAAAQKRLDKYADEIADLNADLVPYAKIPVPKGTVLTLPKKESYTTPEPTKVGTLTLPAGTTLKAPATYTVPADTTLGAVALELLESEDKAAKLFALNKDKVTAPVLPADTKLKLPQSDWPSVAVFALLILALGLIGIRRPPAEQPRPADDQVDEM